MPTTEGDLRLQEVVDRGRKVYVSFHERQGAEEVLFRALQVPIVDGVRYGAWPFAQKWCEQRGVPVVRLGTRGGDAALFPPADDDAPDGARGRLEALFGDRSRAAICLTRFEPDYLPLVLVHDQEVELKAATRAGRGRQADFDGGAGAGPVVHTGRWTTPSRLGST